MIRVPPFHYIHVQDNNANTQRVEVGPQSFTKRDHETVVKQPTKMLVLPPYHYCIVSDPYVRENEKTKQPQYIAEGMGQAMLRYGEQEIRFWDDWTNPFPLLPGENLHKNEILPLETVQVDCALRLYAMRDIVDETEGVKKAGDEWLFHGPKTYRPRVEVKIVKRVNARVIAPDHAIQLKATKDCVDSVGVERKAGEEWLIREAGSYLPGINEEVVLQADGTMFLKPYFLVRTKALHLRATHTFEDLYNRKHLAGEEWLVTIEDSELHITDIYEQVVGEISLTILQKDQYCEVVNPVEKGKNTLGKKIIRKGNEINSFFLLPGESIPKGIQKIHILKENEALLIKATESFVELEGSGENERKVERNAGDMWLRRGPLAYTPRAEITIIEKRIETPMAANEGIYVRNKTTGEVRAIKARTYMLEAHEELWNKDLPQLVEQQISHRKMFSNRVKHKLVTYRPSYNAAVNIYDYKTRKLRVAFGPDLVTLAPDEQFAVFSLSGDTPKRPHVITTLELRLGPDFMTDDVELETSDHARLKVRLSYNWHFEIDPQDPTRIFQVKDFVGDACKALASRVRGAVAGASFDNFHKNSARIIREAVFGATETGKIKDSLTFTANQLCITNVDIQSVEPVDDRTRESLQKSVQLAIEITTRKQERAARFVADEMEQKAKGELQCQKILNQKDIEKERKNLVERKNECTAIEASGQAKAEANGRDTKLRIEAKMAVDQAKLAVKASSIEQQAQLEEENQLKKLEFDHKSLKVKMELQKARDVSEVETAKFDSLIKAITPQTIQSIARSGPEMQARLLKGLGLKGYLMTDGNSPINLFNAAKGMVGPNAMQ